MLKTILVSSALALVGATAATACEYSKKVEMSQTAVPPAALAEAPPVVLSKVPVTQQTTLPADPVRQDVAAIAVQPDSSAPKTN